MALNKKKGQPQPHIVFFNAMNINTNLLPLNIQQLVQDSDMYSQQEAKQIQIVKENVFSAVLKKTERFILYEFGEIPTTNFMMYMFMESLRSISSEKLLDIVADFLSDQTYESRKTARLVELMKDNLDKDDVVERIIDTVTNRRTKSAASFDIIAHLQRSSFTSNFSWAIPSISAIHKICEFAADQPILEVGSGLGLWAGLIQARGGKIIPTDSFTTHGTSMDRTFIHVQQMDGVSAVKNIQTPVLFMCWPGYRDPMAENALRTFTGDKFIFVGEGHDGCTATEEFFDLLYKDWEYVEDSEIPSWGGIYDSLSFYIRKSPQPAQPPVELENPVDSQSWIIPKKRAGRKTAQQAKAKSTNHVESNRFAALSDDDC